MSVPLQLDPPKPEETTIYQVDDDELVLASVSRFLKAIGYQVETFLDPRDALESIRETPPDLLLTDKDMPGMTGVELAKAALVKNPDLAIILLTGAGDLESARKSVELGLVDYLLKPPDLQKIQETIQKAILRQHEAVYQKEMETWMRGVLEDKTRESMDRVGQVEAAVIPALSVLVKLHEAKSKHFREHSQGVADLAAGIARKLELTEGEVEEIRSAGLLHDVGMIGVPDRLIDRAGELTPEEFEKLKAHTRIAGWILKPFSHLERAADFALHHHERLDGSGYPDGLAGGDLSLGAQIVGVADAYRAQVESRAWREAGSSEAAMAELRTGEGTLFAKEVLDALEGALG